MAYVRRKANRPHFLELLAVDLASAQVRSFLRREIWNLLRPAGIVSTPEPPPIPASSRPRPSLKIVSRENDDETLS
jgi:hypothetical protein